MTVGTLTVPIDQAFVDAIAAAVLGGLDLPSSATPWLNASEAAEHMRCSVQRIRNLTSQRGLPAYREGKRVLYRRDELDAYIRSGGPVPG